MQGSFVDLAPTTSECRESVFPSPFKTGKLYPLDFQDREALSS